MRDQPGPMRDQCGTWYRIQNAGPGTTHLIGVVPGPRWGLGESGVRLSLVPHRSDGGRPGALLVRSSEPAVSAMG